MSFNQDDQLELDEVNFSDQSFHNQLVSQQFKNGSHNQGKQNNLKRVKDASVLTNINEDTLDDFYFDQETSTQDDVKDFGTQTPKVIASDNHEEDDDYYDEDDQQRQAKNQFDGFEVAGLEAFLRRVEPKVKEILLKNVQNHIFDTYDVIWDDDTIEATQLSHKLVNPYNFTEANSAVQKNLKAQMEADNLKKGGKGAQIAAQRNNYDDDDFDSGFNDDSNQIQQNKSKNKQMTQQSKNQQAKGSTLKNDDRFQVTSIAWSCNGTSLAVAYGKTDHVSWCEHQSVISVWSIFRREFDPKKPDITIETLNCISTLDFHPENPLILAGGSINGEIFIWNIDFDDSKEQNSLIQKSDADEYLHREPIKHITWVGLESINSIKLDYCILSISTDGKILIWNDPVKGLKFPIKGHLIARTKDNQIQSLGGSSMAIIKGNLFGLDELKIIIGTESGIIQRCLVKKPDDKDIKHFLTKNQNVTWQEEAYRFLANIQLNKVADQQNLQKLKDYVDKYMLARAPPRQVFVTNIFGSKPPIHSIYPPFSSKQVMIFEKHYGPVLTISTSPFNKRIFLTGSTDGQIRMYDVQDKKQVATFEPCFGEYINCVQWSPFRAAVFAAVSNSGSLYIYDLIKSKHSPIEIIKYTSLDEDGSTIAVHERLRQAQQLSFNPRQRDSVAVGYLDGFVRIFKLSRSLSNQNVEDFKVLKSFLEQEKKE